MNDAMNFLFCNVQIINTERGKFGVRTYGRPEDPPLIALHGWPQTSYCWHHMATHLRGQYLIAIDLRGMGNSNRALDIKRYHKDEMAKDIFAVADSMDIQDFNLVGHDWGGAIVQEMVFMNADRIRKLIVVNIPIINNAIGLQKANEILVKQFFRSSWYQFFMSIKDFPEAMISGKEDIWVRFFSRGISNPIPEDAIEEYIRCYKIPDTITTTSNIYRTLNEDRERWNQYLGQKVNVPTLIIHGLWDPVIIKEYNEGVEECFEQVVVEQLKGGHFIVDEQPEAVAGLINQFILS